MAELGLHPEVGSASWSCGHSAEWMAQPPIFAAPLNSWYVSRFSSHSRDADYTPVVPTEVDFSGLKQFSPRLNIQKAAATVQSFAFNPGTLEGLKVSIKLACLGDSTRGTGLSGNALFAPIASE